MISLILPLMLLQQTPVTGSNGSVQFNCKLGLGADKTLSLTCGAVEKEKDISEEYLYCETRSAKVRKMVAFYPHDLEIVLVDLTKYTASMNPWDTIVNQNILSNYAVDRPTWDALPPDKQMGQVRQNPPAVNTVYMVTGACIKEILKRLKTSQVY